MCRVVVTSRARPACQLAGESVIVQNVSFIYFLDIAKLAKQRVQLYVECRSSMIKAPLPPQHFFVFVFWSNLCQLNRQDDLEFMIFLFSSLCAGISQWLIPKIDISEFVSFSLL